VFRFAVSSKAVGFHIYNSKCIVRPDFKAFFNLWNFSGPNWSHEYRLLLQEENANWWFVKGKKKNLFANIVQIPPLTGANVVPILRRRLSPRSPGNLVEPRILRKNWRNLGFLSSKDWEPLLGLGACRIQPLLIPREP
jgi:hypothetical protein